MNFKELVKANRTRRVFDESKPLDAATLTELVDTARFTPSARNLQPLKYVVTADPRQCAEIFPLLGWAGYLKDWKGPAEGERPTGYIIITLDNDLTDDPMGDQGIVSQTIMLGAVEKGLGGCIMGAINRKKLAQVLALPENLQILLVLALGVPAENVVVEPLPADGKIEYWRSADGTHHVPKRSLDEVLVASYPKKSIAESDEAK
ncbi:nitroreductase family protein [Pseudodesulfovibrio sp.]|uniref:nitroreductase family protein n=1 Tax=unclassified Pseudodesulfovibrio TaxID=2661612 RepID=UPI003B00EE6C